jgi:hypothetical protein
MPSQATNQFGRVVDFTLLEASSQDDFAVARGFVRKCESAEFVRQLGTNVAGNL